MTFRSAGAVLVACILLLAGCGVEPSLPPSPPEHEIRAIIDGGNSTFESTSTLSSTGPPLGRPDRDW